MKTTHTTRLLLGAIFSLLLIPAVLGFGIASTSLVSGSVALSPGETKVFTLELQNNQPEAAAIQFNLEGQGVAKVLDPQPSYLVGGSRIVQEIMVEVSVPATAKVGDSYQVSYTVSPVTTSNEQAPMSFRLNGGFKVNVVEETPDPSAVEYKPEARAKNRPSTGLIVILLVLLLGAAFLMLHKGHKTPPSKSRRK